MPSKTISQLESLCHITENSLPGLATSIYRRTSQSRLVQCAGPNIPVLMRPKFREIPIGKDVGSCGTAAWSGRQIRVDNIAEDRRWDAYRVLPLQNGFTSCWSQPVRAPNQRIIGTVGFYFSKPPASAEHALEVLQHMANIASQLLETQPIYLTADVRLKALSHRLSSAIEALGLNVSSLTFSLSQSEQDNCGIILANKNMMQGHLLCRMMRDLQHIEVTQDRYVRLSVIILEALQEIGHATGISSNTGRADELCKLTAAALPLKGLLFWSGIWVAGGFGVSNNGAPLTLKAEELAGSVRIVLSMAVLNNNPSTNGHVECILDDYLRSTFDMLGYEFTLLEKHLQRTVRFVVPYKRPA